MIKILQDKLIFKMDYQINKDKFIFIIYTFFKKLRKNNKYLKMKLFNFYNNKINKQ